jgi:uncharacterized protein
MSETRQPFPDLVRACALFGIAVVNVEWFAYPAQDLLRGGAWATPADRFVWWTVATVFLMKSYSLFAMLFGAGMAQQMRAAEAGGAGFMGRYARRMAGLLALGLVNAALLFSGDILVTYALLGVLLLLFRNTGAAALRRWAIGFFLLHVGLSVALVVSAASMAEEGGGAELRKLAAEMAEEAAQVNAAYASTDFFAVAAFRFDEWATFFGRAMVFGGPGVMAFILYGLYAARTGMFEDLDAPRWSRARRLWLPIGLLVAGAGAWVMLGSDLEFDAKLLAGITLVTVGSPLSTLGYLGLVAAWMRRPESRLRAFLTRAGGGSLTAYLLQGLLMSWVFCGYGLGWVGKVGAAAYFSVGVVVATVSLLFVGWWRGRYGLGPMEALLRRWVYLGERRSGA